jgi:hypothetical protein
VRDSSPGPLPWIFAGQSHYPDYLLRGEGRRRSRARLVGEHLFDHLRDERTLLLPLSPPPAGFSFAFSFAFSSAAIRRGAASSQRLRQVRTWPRSMPKSPAIRVLLVPVVAASRMMRTRRTNC